MNQLAIKKLIGFLLTSLLLFSNLSKAQNAGSNFIVGADALLFFPAKIDNNGAKYFRNVIEPNANLFLRYLYKTDRNLELGLGLNLVYTNMGFRHKLQLADATTLSIPEKNYSTLLLKEKSIGYRRYVNLVPEIFIAKKFNCGENSRITFGGGLMFWIDPPRQESNIISDISLLTQQDELQLVRITQDPSKSGHLLRPSFFTTISYSNVKFSNYDFNLRFNFSYSEKTNGSFTYFNVADDSFGTYEQSYSYLSLGISYNVPLKKLKDKLEYFKNKGLGDGLTKRQKEREIKPKTWQIGFGKGYSYVHNLVKAEGSSFVADAQRVKSFGLLIERELNKHWFIQMAYQNQEFTHGFQVDRSNYPILVSSTSKSSHEFRLGVGYRIVGPRNYNYLNINGGLVYGLLRGVIGDVHNYVVQDPMNDVLEGDVWYLQIRDRNSSKSLTAINFGVSKDIKIARNIFINLAYNYQLGFYENYFADISYFKKGDQTPYKASVQSKGSRSSLMFSLKYRVNNRVKPRPLEI